MKRFVAVMLSCVIMMGLCACGGDVSNVEIAPYYSDIYTAVDVQSAINAALIYFKWLFPNCTMTKITYAGDDLSQQESAGRDLASDEDLIVLLSAFDVAESGADGGLEPGKSYHDFQWILIRRTGSPWFLSVYGYA